MGLVREFLGLGMDFVREEILPLRNDLIKAGVLTPDNGAYDPKASLVDPWNYGSMQSGYKEKYSLLDYSKCRQITYADPIVAAVIQTRLNQVAAFSAPQIDKYKVGFKVILRDKEKEPSKADKKRAREIEQFILNCGVPENFEDTPELKKRDNFETFMRKVTRDSLTFDQWCFEVIPRKNGLPYAFQAVDASTIRLIADKKEQVEKYGGLGEKYDPTNLISMGSEKVFKEHTSKQPRYAQVINGIVRHTFDEWEMGFGIRNPRTDLYAQGYGFSEIEMLVTTITSHMNAETYNRKFFSQGSAIKGVIAFEGAVPPDQLEAFRRQWHQQVTGINNAWRTPIMSLGKEGKLNWTSLHANNREMEFGKWLEYCIKTICGVFQIDPIEIGFDISKQGSGQSGGSGGGLGYGNQAERLMYSQDKGLRPLVCHIKALLNEYIVYRIDPNFELDFVGLNSSDEKEEIDKTILKVKNFKTINEVRAEHDLEELPTLEEMGKNPGEMILDPSLIQFITGQLQAAQEPMPGEEGMGEDQFNMPGGPDEVDAPVGPGDEEEEPNYDSMDEDALEQELSKLQGVEKSLSGKTSFYKELDL